VKLDKVDGGHRRRGAPADDDGGHGGHGEEPARGIGARHWRRARQFGRQGDHRAPTAISLPLHVVWCFEPTSAEKSQVKTSSSIRYDTNIP
jgi:hypothetical protein